MATYLREMIIPKMMRHTEFRLRADNEPPLATVVEAVKGVWAHYIRVTRRRSIMAKQSEPSRPLGLPVTHRLLWSKGMGAGWRAQ